MTAFQNGSVQHHPILFISGATIKDAITYLHKVLEAVADNVNSTDTIHLLKPSLQGSELRQVRIAITYPVLSDLVTMIPKAVALLSDLESNRFPIANLPIQQHHLYINLLTRKISPNKVSFIFAGQGSQYPDMMKAYAQSFEPFNAALMAVDNCIQKNGTALSVFDIYDENESYLHDTRYTQLAVFALGYASYKLLRNYDIMPDIVCGHSYGEIVALVAAGVISLKDAVQMTMKRAAIMHQLPKPGSMCALLTTLENAEQLVKECENYVIIANVNTPEQIIVSGTNAGISEIRKLSKKQRIRTIKLKVTHAYHSKIIKASSQAIAIQFSHNTAIRPPCIPVLSNVDNKLYFADLKANERVDILRHGLIQRLTRHNESRVHFTDNIDFLAQSNTNIYIELGPNAFVSKFLESYQPLGKRYIFSLDYPRQSIDGLWDILATLFILGVPFTIPEIKG